jgi:hypothetical protein
MVHDGHLCFPVRLWTLRSTPAFEELSAEHLSGEWREHPTSDTEALQHDRSGPVHACTDARLCLCVGG